MDLKIKKSKEVKGFYLIENYLSGDEEQDLINKINNQKWIVDYKRELQYYNYRNELVKPYDLVPILDKTPEFLEKLIDRLVVEKIVQERPDQIIINKYYPGEGLKPHFDRKDYFKNVIVGISLGSGTILEFYNPPKKKKIYIPARSLYVIKDDARYSWKHGIPPRKIDIIKNKEIPRKTRISITFRNVIKDKVKHDNIVLPQSKKFK